VRGCDIFVTVGGMHLHECVSEEVSVWCIFVSDSYVVASIVIFPSYRSYNGLLLDLVLSLYNYMVPLFMKYKCLAKIAFNIN
jgi:hypothetical protein